MNKKGKDTKKEKENLMRPQQYQQIEISKIKQSSFDIRDKSGEYENEDKAITSGKESFRELVASIKANGVLQHIVVRPVVIDVDDVVKNDSNSNAR